ncbi:MAG TPA: glycoside hydrolase family 15 protein [Gaiellaceae bacterium]|jgi:GH15 family glucan-1,4-alpha-glucosidase|nr:glycoside hydrolase family 15 protein [Gaiellaceae bacterium]
MRAGAAHRPAYLPIADHGVIGDLQSVALVGVDGTIDWYCPRRFDAPSVFGSLLDSTRGGFYRIAPAGEGWTQKQLYYPDTNVLITRFLGPAGVVEVIDFMPTDEPGRLVRRVLGIRGEVRMVIEVEPRFDYARAEHETVADDAGALFTSADLALSLASAVPLSSSGSGAYAEFTVAADESRSFVLETGNERRSHGEDEVRRMFVETTRYWLDWLKGCTYKGRWQEMVYRSALTLKLLTYRPTGAIVAAATTSLPEQLGGRRNWDYRYTWIRDASFTVYALLRLGFKQEAEEFIGWLRARVSEVEVGDGGTLQIMYGVDGRADLGEITLDHLEGYRGSAPVRVGNAAATQLQLDIYGELLDSWYLFDKYGRPIFYEGWQAISKLVDWLAESWDREDEGVWETRGGRQHFTYSRLMCWVAFDRAIRIAENRGFPGDIAKWQAARDAIFRQVHERGYHEERGAFVQHYDTDVLDASLLLMPLVRFISPTDPRWLSTLDLITKELVSDSLVYRYNAAASPDGLEGKEGTFSICTFWWVEALARAGRLDEARLALEKMFTYANHLGLYSEEIGPTGEALGNFPQAFTHLSLISAAVNLDHKLG